MRRNRRNYITLFAMIGMLVLILDSKLVISGAVAGIELCLWTVVPSLFPFFIVSSLICGNIGSKSIGALRYINKVLKIPFGSESILVTGFLGGYPIGAQSIMHAFTNGTLSKSDALRMLAFCNNAGPAFIFGMVAQLFASTAVGWYLWLITVLSAVFVAVSLPGTGGTGGSLKPKSFSISQLIPNAVKAMSNVCSWVILFRIILTILQKRILGNCHPFIQTVLFGFLELSNGVIQTASISDPRIRFVLCAVFLNAGGICVAMQTHSIVSVLGLRTYCIGKTLQTVFSFFLSSALSQFIFQGGSQTIAAISAFICFSMLIIAQLLKKGIAISKKVLYDIKN